SFQCEVYVYVKKVEPPRRRRLKQMIDRTTTQSLQGEYTQNHRLDAGELAVPPVLKRKRSIGSEEDDEQHQTHQTLQGQNIDGGYYRTVRMVVNGAVVPVQVNVQDLLACFTSFQQHSSADVHEGME
ncbi:Hypothetical protein PHPALM_19381, partial [Phytophthora palmivora]